MTWSKFDTHVFSEEVVGESFLTIPPAEREELEDVLDEHEAGLPEAVPASSGAALCEDDFYASVF
jgi:hypothetical protein|tara:strand:+ start:1312 stop:1506 length:195 start_codon:yes stop_codon:yes gene_type:complete